MIRQLVVNEALSWIGTPYAHKQRCKGAGVDCGQILAAIYENTGAIPYYDPGDYPHDWHLHQSEERYLASVEKFAHQIKGPPLPGDIALFKFGRCISHGAIVIAWPKVVHSYIGVGVILDDVDTNMELARRLVGFWSIWS